MSTGQSTKYSLSARERWTLDQDLYVTEHVVDRWDERTPESSRSVEWAVEHAVRDESVVEHPYFAAHSRPTDAAHVYRGRTSDGLDYGVVFPELRDSLTTAYRIGSVAEYARKRGLSEAAATAIATYLRVLGEHGGVVDE